MTAWPYPGDSPLARARRIAQAYRTHLHTAAPHLCTQLDEAMATYGETWVIPHVQTYDLDDHLTTREAADIAHVTPAAVRQWRTRGRLPATQQHDGTWRYRARDVLNVVSSVRTRNTRGQPHSNPPHTTDTLTDQEQSAHTPDRHTAG